MTGARLLAALRALRGPGQLAASIVVALALLLRFIDPAPIETLRLRGFDLEQQLFPRPYAAPTVPIRIVEIDEESLRRFGQWPWPRTLVAKLIDGIAAAEPLVLGIDILFTEPDRYSPRQVLQVLPPLPEAATEAIQSLPASETVLAAALRGVPTVLGLAPLKEEIPNEKPVRISLVRESGGDPRPYLHPYGGLLHSLHEITDGAAGAGALTGEPDADGIVRRIPLMVSAGNRLVPALSVELLHIASGGAPIGVSTGAAGIRGISLADSTIPTDAGGRAYPYFTCSLTVRYISAASVLDGTFDRSALHDGIALLGITGLGLVDLKQAPTGAMQGIEIHAQMLESVLLDSVLRRPAGINRLELVLVAIIGFVMICLLPYQRTALAIAGAMALCGVCLVGEFALFRTVGFLVDGVYAAGSALAAFGVMLGANLRETQAAKRKLAAELEREREAKARLEGELAAARSIQMGLLPRKTAPLTERSEVELEALIEPARVIGGDLYDFLLIDRNHLFFAVADVSGKGIPAALFMATTKEILRAAVVGHGTALDRAMAEANAKVAATSADLPDQGADMMFVTVFAAILDLHSGNLRYTSAGHDAPFSLRHDEAPEQLTASGGPPLGAVDDFAYPINHRRLRPGDTLFLFTDGVTEAQNVERELYSMGRLTETLSQMLMTEPRATIAHVKGDLDDFVDGAEPADDVTMLVLRWHGPRG